MAPTTPIVNKWRRRVSDWLLAELFLPTLQPNLYFSRTGLSGGQTELKAAKPGKITVYQYFGSPGQEFIFGLFIKKNAAIGTILELYQ